MTVPKAVKDFLKKIGSKGGSAGTPAQRAAQSANAKKGRRPIDPNSKRQQMLRAKALKAEQAAAMPPETSAEVSPPSPR